jgi:pimeloyl-ACP methyl ester carboxylesterase
MSKLTFNENHHLHYEWIAGEVDRPHLVFLHEGLGCHAMWKKFPKRLCNRTGCPGLVYDRLGYGKSSPLRRTRTIHYLHDYALKELPQVIDALIPNKPFILIGHSDGGSISLIFGAEKPPYLRGIITEAAHVFVERETLDGIRKADEAFEKGKFSGLFKYHGEKTQGIFKAWSETWLSQWFKYWNIEYLLPSIEVPMLVIQGCDDRYGTKDQVDSIISKSAGKAVPSLVENCGHSPHQELLEFLLELMSRFIAQVTAETR